MILYGIPNCDTVKKARAWLDKQGFTYTFHDYKKLGISKKQIAAWCDELGFETLINKRGTTWQKLPHADKAILTKTQAIALMAENPSLIKRPILDTDKKRIIGFDTTLYQQYCK